MDTTAPHSILMGGGIGITPMLSMAYSLKQQGKSFEIHYSCTSPEKAGFLDILENDFCPLKRFCILAYMGKPIGFVPHRL